MPLPDLPDAAPPQARDVVAFGQEVGRVLSDGRIVGRAEPFAKVFPSSRAVKRAVGVTAWAVLEDIALDAQIDREGRLVAETNVRRIAGNLGLATNTVARHLARLREHGFVLHEEGRDRQVGRFDTARYVLDPAAALERFTVTPPATTRTTTAGAERDSAPCRDSCDTDGADCRSCGEAAPCRKNCDTGQDMAVASSSAVSQSVRHRGLRHNSRTVADVQQQQTPSVALERDGDEGSGNWQLLARLTDLGVDAATAASLVAEHPGELITDALDAVAGVEARKPAGWVVAAVRGGWEVGELAAGQRRLAARRDRVEAETAARQHAAETAQQRQARVAAWAAAAVRALDDDQLTAAVEGLTAPVPGLGRRTLPEVRARVAGAAAAAHLARPDIELAVALTAALPDANDAGGAYGIEQLPPSPAADGDDLDEIEGRLHAAIRRADAVSTQQAEEGRR